MHNSYSIYYKQLRVFVHMLEVDTRWYTIMFYITDTEINDPKYLRNVYFALF